MYTVSKVMFPCLIDHSSNWANEKITAMNSYLSTRKCNERVSRQAETDIQDELGCKEKCSGLPR